MTETRTDPTITADTPPERAAEATPAKTGADTERLSTADIARGDRSATGTTDGGAAGPDGPTPGSNGRDHVSEIPGPRETPLFSEDASAELRNRWTDVQAGFVDEPRSSVEQADALVAEVMKRLADSFATERQGLEQQWQTGDEASTEDLRVALRRYRSFFDRLLSV